ncbi:MAG: hypothetical protein A3H79_00070 [Candidatus Levybacteria bacterium RIFCSPLOWO2_02_FULL_36_8b]|nr:MAG: hypothetical protein A3H79_00070 [Candidatus Levybacteria bacterium RIFCSPLOWO2_02_FULL_36_8b]
MTHELTLSVGESIVITAVPSVVSEKKVGIVSEEERKKALEEIRSVAVRYEQLGEDRALDPYDETLLGPDEKNMFGELVRNLRKAGIKREEITGELVDVYTRGSRNPIEPKFAKDKARDFVGFLSRFAETIPQEN